MTTIIVGLPPNFEQIDAFFHIRRLNLQKLAICYGEHIYMPKHWIIPPEQILHERVHMRQQVAIGGPEVWWSRYLESKQFRWEQELEASRAEWRAFLDAGASRPARRHKMASMVRFLSGPIYRHMITAAVCRREILGGSDE